ncbi:MAG: ECF-type sigma factor [Thermoanaerobaculia bacterium]|nr:ECF-type sigma factor [Thermoanaerobaculia bacterium]
MTTADPQEVTRLLARLRDGDQQAFDKLFPLVYGELMKVARRRRGNRPAAETMNTTAVVHEVFLKLSGSGSSWKNRAHFFAVAAQAMRQILTDYARKKSSAKRGGEDEPLSLDERLASLAVTGTEAQADWILDLHLALADLSDLSPRMAQVVEYRYFGGLTEKEISEVLDLSERTVRRDWDKARAWLSRRLDPESDSSD